MAGQKNLKATISFAGKISPDWFRSVKTIDKGLQTAGKSTEKLKNDQQKLAEKIRAAKLAGRSVEDLTKNYRKLGEAIKRSEHEQQGMNKALARAQRFKNVGGALKRGLFSRAGGAMGQIGGMMGPGLSIGGGGVIASALATLIAPAATNSKTAEKVGLARQYGVDAPTYNAWDSLAGQYGLTGENFGDLYEEYLKKAGEFKATGKQNGLSDAFDTLGYKEHTMAGKSDLEQFNKVIEDALKMKDVTQASFALDSLFGAEASKFLMMLKMSGKTLGENIQEQKRYNLVTEEGARGALRGHQAMQNLQTVFQSALAEISGQLGDELSPDIRRFSDDLAEWFRGGGISKITAFLRHDLYPGVLSFGSGVAFVGKIIFALAKKLSWLLPDEQTDRRDVLNSLARTGSVEIAKMTAERSGQGEWFSKKLQDDPHLPDRVKKAYTSTRGFVIDDNDAYERQLKEMVGPEEEHPTFDFNAEMARNRKALESDEGDQQAVWPGLMGRVNDIDLGKSGQSRQITDNSQRTYDIKIFPLENQSPADIAEETINRAKSMDAFNGNNSLFDVGEPW